MWCIPPKQNAGFVCAMPAGPNDSAEPVVGENVLDVYKRPYDPKRPQVCLDETSKQLVGEKRIPLPASPGRAARYDYEYVRNGVANLFMAFEPLAGKRRVEVTERRTRMGGRRMDIEAQRQESKSELAFHDRRRKDQAQETLPIN